MMRLTLSVLTMMVLALSLSSCGTRQKTLQEELATFDVRQVVVTADARIADVIIVGTQRRIEAAIKMTNRVNVAPRVVANLHIDAIRKGMGMKKGRSEADVTITVASVDTGEEFRAVRFQVYSFTTDPRQSDEAMAESIASRVRYMFALVSPPVAAPVKRAPKLSTLLATEPGVDAPVGPVVVPVSEVKTIGANADPVLNSKTVIKPVEGEATEPAKVEPAMKAEEAKPAPVDEGASTKVELKPKSDQPAAALDTTSEVKPASDEPCVETLENKCPAN